MTTRQQRGSRILKTGIATALALGIGAATIAAIDPAALCEAATRNAAEQTGVPVSVLQAIALAESAKPSDGAQRPWPWTVNFAGQGYWYASTDEAQLAVEERQSLGATNFDIGCFQLNHRWHGQAFPTIAAMFDPDRNALYAAQFLQQLHTETGSWPDAAAAYHSRTPEYAEPYRARFETLYDGIAQGGPAPRTDPLRENRFPLLRAGAVGALGSLVPQQSGGISLIGDVP